MMHQTFRPTKKAKAASIFRRISPAAMAGAIFGLSLGIQNANAQPAAPTAEPIYGPVISGVCVFSRDAAIDNSAAGLAATKRMQELTQQVNADLQPERDAIAKEQTALNAQTATSPSLKQRSDALALREQTFNQKVQSRNGQLARTRQDALARLTDALRPALVSTITTNKCSVVLDRTNLYGFNTRLDITPAVTAAMNMTAKPFTFGLAPEANLTTAGK